MRKKFRLVRGKIRRYATLRFRKGYVEAQVAERRGECNHCGNCCEILFRCPFLISLDDGSSQCSIYEDRPGQCAAFPIDARDLADVDFDCTYTFGDEGNDPLVDIEPVVHAALPGSTTEPDDAPGRFNPARALPILLLHRLLDRTR